MAKQTPPQAKFKIEIVCPGTAQTKEDGSKIEAHFCDDAYLYRTQRGRVGICATCRYHMCRTFINDPLIVGRYYDGEKDGRGKEKSRRERTPSTG